MNTVGQDFVLMFMQNGSPDRDVEIFVTTSVPSGAYVTVTTPATTNPTVDQRVNAPAQQLTRIIISRNIIAVGSERSNKGIRISSSAEITVTAFNRQDSNCDGFRVFPTRALGTAYIAVTAPLNPQIGIVSPGDNIAVEITFPSSATISVNLEGTQYRAGSTFSTTLNECETLQIQDSSGGAADLTGTLITSSEPVAVFSGNSITYIGTQNQILDHTMEQLPPVSTWGTDFIFFPTPNTDLGGVIKIVASQPSTTVQVYTSTVLQRSLVRPGDFIEVEFKRDEYSRVSSQNPVLVVHFSLSGGSVPSEPAMTVIPPREQYLPSYQLAVPNVQTGLFQNYLFLTTRFTEVPNLLIDNVRVDATAWIPVASTSDGTAVKRVSVPSGFHSVRSSNNALVGVYQYGYVDSGCAYEYSAGQCLDVINSVVSKISFVLFAHKTIVFHS